jgi:sigma-B regulation protein RsbU (phosphoserine phosphatase)
VTPWGQSVVVSTSASPVRDKEGRITGATLVFRDQSERVEFERERQELLEREHHIAEMLQQALLPSQQAYYIGGYNIALRYQPGYKELTIGGDFYDVFELGEGKIGIVIGDVAGKGLLAAMRVAAARYAIRSYAYLDPSPAVCLTLANNSLSRGDEDGSSMLTAVFAVIDTRDNTLTYGNAGHEPPVVIDRDGNMRELEPTGLALGVLENMPYGERSIELRPGEIVTMFTDGITEARHDGNVFFDKEGVIEYLAKSASRLPDEIASGLLDAAKTHAGGQLQDDAAIVVFGLANRE